jgi:Family of unknown function (DUF6364)
MTEYRTYMAKLTLSVDEKVVKVAKRYADRRGTSVSRLVEEYLAVLSGGPDSTENTPILSRVQGLLKGSRLDERDYRKHLREKYR